MKARVVWNDNLSFTGISESGFTVPLDSLKAVGGNEDGFRPMELMAISVGSCTAMDVISILRKKRLDVSGFEVVVRGDRSTDHPKKFNRITIEYIVRGKNIDEASVERAVELSEEKYCAAIATIRGNVEILNKITIESEE